MTIKQKQNSCLHNSPEQIENYAGKQADITKQQPAMQIQFADKMPVSGSSGNYNPNLIQSGIMSPCRGGFLILRPSNPKSLCPGSVHVLRLR